MYDAPNLGATVEQKDIKISAKKVQVYYGETHAIKDVDIEVQDKTVTAFIGPSGCGKSTFLRCLNRMNDTIDICRVEGEILLDGEDIYDKRVDPVQLRAKVGTDNKTKRIKQKTSAAHFLNRRRRIFVTCCGVLLCLLLSQTDET